MWSLLEQGSIKMFQKLTLPSIKYNQRIYIQKRKSKDDYDLYDYYFKRQD